MVIDVTHRATVLRRYSSALALPIEPVKWSKTSSYMYELTGVCMFDLAVLFVHLIF